MDNQKLLTEEKYQKSNAKVKKIGKVLLISGIITLVISIIFIVAGFVNTGSTASNSFNGLTNSTTSGFDYAMQNAFSNSAKSTMDGMFGSMGLFALGAFLNFIGFVLTVAGGVMMFMAHRREIMAYTTQQVMPVAQEGIEKMTPTVANAAGSVARSISKGIKEGQNDFNNQGGQK